DVGALGGRLRGLVQRELDQRGLQQQPDGQGRGEQERSQTQQTQPDGASSHALCSSNSSATASLRRGAQTVLASSSASNRRRYAAVPRRDTAAYQGERDHPSG